MHNNQKSGLPQRTLPFEDEEVWATLPEQVRDRCRSLCSQLLAVVSGSERRQDERED